MYLQHKLVKHTVCKIIRLTELWTTPRAKLYFSVSSNPFIWIHHFLPKLHLLLPGSLWLFSFIDIYIVVTVVKGLQSCYGLLLTVLPGLCLQVPVILNYVFILLLFHHELQVGKFYNCEKLQFHKLALFIRLYSNVLVYTSNINFLQREKLLLYLHPL